MTGQLMSLIKKTAHSGLNEAKQLQSKSDTDTCYPL